MPDAARMADAISDLARALAPYGLALAALWAAVSYPNMNALGQHITDGLFGAALTAITPGAARKLAAPQP